MYKTIMVPISFDNDRDAAGALEVAKLLAGDDGKILIIHVIEQIPAYVISYVPAEYMDESRKAITAELNDIASKIPNAEGILVDGHSGKTIVEYASSHEVDCIVIASHRPGMQDLFLGSTAQQVVRHAPCAVHVIR
ncbi:universal stress protein [Roseovarius aestuariivivens]|uniref:universal stress protein n=1 Tax=Roseovarius aestuariivivens TaxID=1888910 RepID=UPI0010820104|nr:universal stress protein [Roseovarius aestuariivivens]